MTGRVPAVDEHTRTDAPDIDYDGLYSAQWRPMLRLAQSLVDDTASAEDVVQDAFAAVYRRRDALRDPAAVRGYLHSCVVNGARSALRRRRTVRSKLAILAEGRDSPAADQQVLLSAEHARVRARLSSLPRRQREVLALRFLADLEDIEIARVLGTSHANVRSAASRGLAALRTALVEATDTSTPDTSTGEELS